MQIIRGNYFDGQQAQGHAMSITLDDHGMLHPTPALFSPVHISDVELAPQLGNLSRTLHLKDNAAFETDDHEQLTSWLDQHKPEKGWVHRLENSWRNVFFALLITIGFVVWTAKYGIPMMSEQIAYVLPEETNVFIGRGVMESLDERFFEESELSETRQADIRDQFFALLPEMDSDRKIVYDLKFRGGGWIGANAFALPDGTVVITDELVELADRDEEILSVLLHEIGHVEYRHSLRQLISHSSLAGLSMLFLGDVNSAGAIIFALPSVLMESGYSRELEWEADTYALEQMQAKGFDPIHFANFMHKLENYVPEDLETSESDQEVTSTPIEHDHEVNDELDQSSTDEESLLQYLSTHPATADRIKRFQDAATLK